MAHEYLEVQTKMAYLQNHMKDLAERLTVTEQQQEDEEIQKLENEKVVLVLCCILLALQPLIGSGLCSSASSGTGHLIP